ncbi:MAG: hypothetical protein DWH91_15450 [Planctomycetota bacterium]|nr:MAG: hypothetical protein DWH91_15450 [Planctomycetota bacterium]
MSAFFHRLAVGFGIGIFLLNAVTIFAADYTSLAGYTLQIPEGWVAASFANLNQLPPEIQKYLVDQKLDLKAIDLLVLGPEEFGQFRSNLNVVVTPGQIPVGKMTPEQFQKQATDQYQKLGVTISNHTVRKVNVAEREVFEMIYDATMPWAMDPIRQRQLMIPGGGKTFVVTFTSTLEGYAEDSKIFDAIQQTIQVPVETWSLGNGILSSGLRGGILGGLIGGAVAVFAKFRKKSPPATNAESDN